MFKQDKFGGQVLHLLLKFLTAPVGLNHFVFLFFIPLKDPLQSCNWVGIILSFLKLMSDLPRHNLTGKVIQLGYRLTESLS